MASDEEPMSDEVRDALRDFEADGGTVHWSDCTTCGLPYERHNTAGICPPRSEWVTEGQEDQQ